MNGINSIRGMSPLPPSTGNRTIDSAEIAQQLFNKLDTSSQGYLELPDLQSALTKVASVSETANLSTDTYNADELFSRLDRDSDGKITEEEFTDSLAQLYEEINIRFSQLRMNGAMSIMMPPPPHPPAASDDMDDIGFTEEELLAYLEETDEGESTRSTLIDSIVTNFDEADTEGGGRVSNQEATAFDQSGTQPTGPETLAATDTDSLASDKTVLQLVQLLQAYDLGESDENNFSSSISISI
jgi:hypothetical protein